MLGIRVGSLAAEPMGGTAIENDGWNDAERKVLQSKIAARNPFLDYIFSRINTDGSHQKFQVSGEPMYDRHSRFVGYRGIGFEIRAN